MSGRTPDSDIQQQILDLIQELRKSAELNNDHALIMKLDDLWQQVYNLETY
jgi:hypothetical protein